MAGFADSTREGGFAGAAGAGTSSSAGTSSGGGLAGSTRDGGFAGAASPAGGGGNGGNGGNNTASQNFAASTREGGSAGAGVSSLSQRAQAQRPSVTPGAGNIASGGIAGIKSSTGFFSGAVKSADYDTIQKAVVAARSPLDAFGSKTLTEFGIKSFQFKNDLDDYEALLAATPKPTAAQKAQFETLGQQLQSRGAALQQEASTISGLPASEAGFSALAQRNPFDVFGTYAPETYGLTVNKAGVGTAPGYGVVGPYNLGEYGGVYLGVTDKAPTMVTKGIADLAPEQSSFASPVQTSSLAPLAAPGNIVGRDPYDSTGSFSTTPMGYTYSGPKTGIFEQFGGAMAPGLSTAAMAAGYRAATGTVPASEYANQYFQSRGLSPIQSAALVARLEHESSLNPDKWSAVPGESSYGLAQWNEQAGRLPQMENYAASYNAPASDFDTQLNFIVREMNTAETGPRNALMAATTPTAALNAVTAYERPFKYTPSNPSLASGYEDTANRFNAIISGEPFRNYDVLSGTEFKGPGASYAAPGPVAGQKQISDRVVGENEIVSEDIVASPASAPVDLTGLNANPPLEATRFLREPQNIVPANYGTPQQVSAVEVQRRTGAPAIPNYNQNFFGSLIEKFTGINQGNNYRPFAAPVALAERGGEGRGGSRKPILPTEGSVAATATVPENTGLVWDFQAGQAPVVSAPPDVYAQYRALFAQPAPVSTGVGSLLPSMEVVPVRV